MSTKTNRRCKAKIKRHKGLIKKHQKKLDEIIADQVAAELTGESNYRKMLLYKDKEQKVNMIAFHYSAIKRNEKKLCR